MGRLEVGEKCGEGKSTSGYRRLIGETCESGKRKFKMEVFEYIDNFEMWAQGRIEATQGAVPE